MIFSKNVNESKIEYNSNKKKQYIEKAVAIAAALLVWQIVAMNLRQAILLPSPIIVGKALGQLLFEEAFFKTVWFSFSHIAFGFLLGLIVGTVLAILSAKFHVVEVLVWPYMAAIKATPVASFIILCLVWLSSRNLSIFICFLMVLPVVYTNILNGIRNLDSNLEEMALLYHLSAGRKFLAITMPQLRTYILAALEISIGMAWKAGVAAEVIGIPNGSIGKMLYNAKIYLDTPELFAWSIMVVVISILFEKIVIFLVKSAYKKTESLLWITCRNSNGKEQRRKGQPDHIQISNLNFSYGDQKILNNFDLEIEPGEVVCIMGPSGCGKTTLLKILTGLNRNYFGKIKGLDGKRIGMVFQENRLCDMFSTAFNIQLTDSVEKQQIIQALQEVGLADSTTKKVCELSGGMKRRTAIVRAMLSTSDILIFDEPCKGLDLQTKEIVLDYINSNLNGRTLIVVTHDSSEAKYLNGRIIEL